MEASACPWCGSRDSRQLAVFREALPGEKLMGVDPGTYRRELRRCTSCGHISNHHDHAADLARAYHDGYRAEAYGASILKTYERIRALPDAQSDNAGRIAALRGWLRETGRPDAAGRLLDVGSGSCVFGGAMRDAGWSPTAVDVDPVSTKHAREVAGVAAVSGEFLEIDLRALAAGAPWDLATFNKVLEHVSPENAVAMLKHAAANIRPHGAIYVELPDADGAFAAGGATRQEFFFEHVGAFTGASLALLARRAGSVLERLAAIREPSGKYTIRALLRPTDKD
jgi:2-polyprenyl-3-methyl-5-hydroxy-6-metoxy-1,4-benzoquinol methylase